MTKPFSISLKPGERIFINGAVVRVDRKVSIEFLNDVTFLLEAHVMQPEQTTTPFRQLYFIVQTMLMDPTNTGAAKQLFELVLRQSLQRTVEPRNARGALWRCAGWSMPSAISMVSRHCAVALPWRKKFFRAPAAKETT